MIGLDIAKKTGVAYNIDDTIYCFVIVGEPFVQAMMISEAMRLSESAKIVAEDLPRLRNMKTTKSLLRRHGHIESILGLQYRVVEYVPVSKVRKWFGASKKDTVQEAVKAHAGIDLTNDETDAIAVLLFGLKKRLHNFKIERVIVKDWKCLSSLKARRELAKQLLSES